MADLASFVILSKVSAARSAALTQSKDPYQFSISRRCLGEFPLGAPAASCERPSGRLGPQVAQGSFDSICLALRVRQIPLRMTAPVKSALQCLEAPLTSGQIAALVMLQIRPRRPQLPHHL
jgi:hypothetical protein